MHSSPNDPQATKYEIQISGRLSQERAEWFGDMQVSVRRLPGGEAVSILTGEVPDQAALFGILSRIRDLGLRLIAVNLLEP